LYTKQVVMQRAENLIFSIVLIFSTFPVHFYHSIRSTSSLFAERIKFSANDKASENNNSIFRVDFIILSTFFSLT
jgi:hypothetical protein